MIERTYTVREIGMDLVAGALMAIVLRLIFANIWLGLAAGIAIGAALLWPHRAFLKQRLPVVVMPVARAVKAYTVRGVLVGFEDVVGFNAQLLSKIRTSIRKARARIGTRKRYSRAFRNA